MRRRELAMIPLDFHQQKGEQHLLVWGALGCWLVVDGELWALLGLLNGRRRPERALEVHARRCGRPLAEVEAEARPVMARLQKLGVLTRRRPSPTAPAEVLGVANVTLNLTNRCNLRCGFCYNDLESGGELDVELIVSGLVRGKGILDPDATLIILGGEPTLQMDRLDRLLQGTADLFGPAPMLSTNGTRLSRDNVQRLARHRLEVQVSLDSPTARGHDTLRGEGTFDRAVQGVERLVAAGVHTILSMVITRNNLGELEAYLDLARRLGASEARFIPLRLMGRGTDRAADLPDLTVAFEALQSILKRRPELRPLLVRDFFSILKTVCGQTAARSGCGVGARVIFIDADGRVFPCPNHRLEQLCLGSLAEADLEHLLRGSAVLEEVRDAYRVDNYPGCRACPFRYWCAGDCRGEALNTTGDPFAPPPHCQELRQLIPRMMWILSEEQATGQAGAPAVHLG